MNAIMVHWNARHTGIGLEMTSHGVCCTYIRGNYAVTVEGVLFETGYAPNIELKKLLEYLTEQYVKQILMRQKLTLLPQLQGCFYNRYGRAWA